MNDDSVFARRVTHAPPGSTQAVHEVPGQATALPLVSVLMPIRNEEQVIRAALEAVLTQDWPAEKLEVLVIDGRSRDGTREAVAETAARHPQVRLRLLDNPHGFVPHGLNLGLAAARGSYISRVDGHCLVARDHLRRCFERMQTSQADNVGGLAFAVAETTKAQAIAAGVSSPFGVGGARFRHRNPKPGWVDTVFPGFWRRETFELLGGFDEELVKNQDDEFNFRLQRAGGRIWLEPALKTLYKSRGSLRGLWRQYFEYGLYKVRVAQKHGGVARLRHLVPSLFVLALGVSLVAAAMTGVWWLALVMLGPYLLASCAASVMAARRSESGGRVVMWLPPVFAVLHLAYGLGFLRGLWRFRKYGLPFRWLRHG